MNNAVFTPFGQKIINLLDENINKHLINIDYDCELSKNEINNHYKEWIKTNKHSVKPQI